MLDLRFVLLFQNKSGNDSAGALGGGLKDVVNIDGKSSAASGSASGSLGGQSDCDYDLDSADEDGEEKERHTSGESVDSALSFSLSSSINSAGDSGIAGGVQQVWPLTHFFLFPFSEKSLICLEGKSMTPHRVTLFSFVPPSNSLVSVSDP